jgi:adenylate cyclase
LNGACAYFRAPANGVKSWGDRAEKQFDGECPLSAKNAQKPPAAPKEAAQPRAKRLRLTIGAKLVGLIALLLIASVASLVRLSTDMFIEDNTALIQQMNSDSAGSLATRMRDSFREVTDKMRMLGTVMAQESVPAEVRSQVTHEFFAKDPDFLAVAIHKSANTAAPERHSVAVSPEIAAQGDADGVKTLAALGAEKDFSIGAMARGAIQLAPFRMPDGSTAIAVGVPFIAEASEPLAPGSPAAAAPGASTRISHTHTAVIRQSKFLKAVSESDTVTSYMVDSKGHLLAHPDAARAAASEDVSQTGIVRIMLEGKAGNGQTRYADPQTGEWRLGSFRLVGFGGLGIISEVPEAKAFEAAQGVKRRSMYVAGIVLCLSFLIGYLYSGTITWPIRQLVDAAHKIQRGDFAIDLKPKGRDEVATLSLAFNDMAKGLEERDRVKETFNKFHNKEIAEKLLSGEVKLGGERKEATIFFSDVRGFTAMSETMEPEQVVEMLNEYMTRMVSIIRAHNGIVDKYVGDAIMAIWGVPIGGPDDQLNAVKACIAMRAELANLNELRISRGQSALKIGMGLNTGSVIAGNIGSDEKMEYTVIGDSVNLASRMESMTKEYGTDLLIPKVIQSRLADRFIFEQCKSAKVKGKSQAIEIFKVKGYIDANGQEVIVQTPYSEYESEKSDKVVHDDEPKHAPAVAMAPHPVPPPAPPSSLSAASTLPPTMNAAPTVERERTITMSMPGRPAPKVVSAKPRSGGTSTSISRPIELAATPRPGVAVPPAAPAPLALAPAPAPAPAPVSTATSTPAPTQAAQETIEFEMPVLEVVDNSKKAS